MSGLRMTDGSELARSAIAIGWATVDLDRASEQLRERLARGAVFEPAHSCRHLGARCRVGRVADRFDGPAFLVILEPSTEGRLAAALARHGEGWCATWYEEPTTGVGATTESGPGEPLTGRMRQGVVREGPLGPETLIPGDPAGGPYRLLVMPVTIGPMTEPDLIIRPATAADAEEIATLLTDEGYPTGASDVVERLTRYASPHSQVLVAEHDGEVLGFIAFHAMPRLEHDDRIVRILALIVDAGARERGVGGSLMNAAEDAATELGAAFIEVTAGHHRPDAKRLYEAEGYDASVAAYLRKKL